MPDTFSGGCACGAIRYSSSGRARYMGNCHCRHCQQATGSAFFPAVLVKDGTFVDDTDASPLMAAGREMLEETELPEPVKAFDDAVLM